MSTVALDSHDTQHHGAPPATCKFGMIIFLISEAMLFAGLIAGYIVLRGAHPGDWPPAGYPDIQVQWPLTTMNIVMIVNSIILIGSSFTYHFAEAAVSKGKSGILWLIATLILGSIFLSVQGWEWVHLKHEGLWWDQGLIYGSCFFAITGFHGMHVFVGLLLILWILLKQTFTGCFTPQRHAAMANVGLYWHFVDAVWIVVYTSLYVI